MEQSVELVFTSSLGVDDDKTPVSFVCGISSKAQSMQEIVEGPVSVAMSEDIEVL